MNKRSLCIAARLENLAEIRRFIAEAAVALGADPAAVDSLVLAVDEIASNAILHGYCHSERVELVGQAETAAAGLRSAPGDSGSTPWPGCRAPRRMAGSSSREETIEVEVERKRNRLTVCLRDQAPPFDPTCVPMPDVTLPLEMRQPGGLGVFLARNMVDEMRYCVTPQGGNELTLIKKLQA